MKVEDAAEQGSGDEKDPEGGSFLSLRQASTRSKQGGKCTMYRAHNTGPWRRGPAERG